MKIYDVNALIQALGVLEPNYNKENRTEIEKQQGNKIKQQQQ